MSQITLTEADKGASFTLKKDDIILIQLKENPTTGYRWMLIEDTNIISLESKKIILPEDPKIGEGGIRQFEFKAISSGTEKIHLKHWCEWEGDKSVIELFDVKIVVSK